MKDQAYVLLARAGATWAVAARDVLEIGRTRGVTTVTTAHGTLWTDGVVDRVDGLGVRPLGNLARQHLREPILALALHHGRPVLVVDPANPPTPLRPRRRPGTSRTPGGQ